MTSSAKPDPKWAVAGGQWRTHAEQSLAARKLLCSLLGYDTTVEHNPNGAPFLPDHPNLHISLSHCRTAVAVAVCEERNVGIDIESRRRISPSLMERVCCPEELETVHRSNDPEMEFLRLWTRKEAVLKCSGTGIKGFGSMIHALEAAVMAIEDLPCDLPDTVVSLAVVKGE